MEAPGLSYIEYEGVIFRLCEVAEPGDVQKLLELAIRSKILPEDRVRGRIARALGVVIDAPIDD